MRYDEFLNGKYRRAEAGGFEPTTLNANLFPFQADIVRWACRMGRAACFASTGLGKTLMQLAWAEQVHWHNRGKVLILTPLAVAEQTRREAEKFNVAARIRVVREQADVLDGISICNYERLHKIDCNAFAGVVLDESSILKAFTGKTKRTLLQQFESTPYKLACSATPAPNDHLEFGNHAEFLNVMPSNEMIARWFINDSMEAGHYRLKRHGEKDFWLWLTSWAVCVTSPADLGYPEDGFRLPPLNRKLHIVSSADIAAPTDALFQFENLSATNLHKTMRATAKRRAAKVAELVAADPREYWLIWCNTDYEADELAAAIPDAVEIRGSQSIEAKEDGLNRFAGGEIRRLISKPSICGHGMNFQHCHNMAFVGVSYSFEAMYQATRRCWRFGQTMPVNCHVVVSDAETKIIDTLERKEGDFVEMQRAMQECVKEGQLDSLCGKRTLKPAPAMQTESGENWTMYMGDCVESCKALADASVDLTIFSPPFSNLYIYSDSIADMGNAADDKEFFAHFDFLIPELYRVTIPGRLCCVHCKDLPLYFNRDKAAGLKDFPGEIIRHFEAAGWTYHSRITIWKDPVIEMQRTKNNGLLHKTVCRDSSQVRQGMADYVIVFRRVPPDTLMSDKPIERPTDRGKTFARYVGADTAVQPSQYCKAGRPTDPSGFGLEVWQRYASPVWFDIAQTNVLNYRKSRGEEDEKHICPLQLQVIERCVELWSLPGETVLSPFAGIGSEGYQSILCGRKFIGMELKQQYFVDACKNLRRAEQAAMEANPMLWSATADTVREPQESAA